MSIYTDLAQQGFKIEDNSVTACNGVGLKNLLVAGKEWLQAHADQVNRLNVFPVPDGDTGTNMLLTMRAAVTAAELATDHTAGAIAAAAARGALLGARGNSGVILSQFLQGMAAGLGNRVHFTTADFAHAARLGVAQAYQSVTQPVEGTILTVARAVSEAAQSSANSTHDLVVQLSDVVNAARVAQASTPELLPVLKQAGVTDSGGQGLLYIFEGWLRFLYNQPVDAAAEAELAPAVVSEIEDYGYDVQFLIGGSGLDVAAIRAKIDSLGWSTVVVGSDSLVKVHVHTHDPGAPLSYAAALGTISDVVVEDLNRQARAFLAASPAAPPTAAVGIVVVSSGPGFEAIFRGLGAGQVVAGGQTMNPSTQELLAAIEQIPNENVLIFPNNCNIMLTAQQAAALSGKAVRVMPTETVPQGIAALVAFHPELDAETNAARMREAAGRVVTIEVTRAARHMSLAGVEVSSGAVIGLVNGQLRGSGPETSGVVLDILAQLDDQTAGELLTLYFGAGTPATAAQALAAAISERRPQLEIEIYSGGQPHYDYIISLE